MIKVSVKKIDKMLDEREIKELDETVEYLKFKKVWQQTHSISPVPSFKTWLKDYQGK